MAYLPTQLPAGYGFLKWGSDSHGFEVAFGPTLSQEIVFDVFPNECSVMGNSMHTFNVNGVNVEWSATHSDAQAWRCLSVNGQTVVISATRAIAGDDSLDTSQGLTDAQQLADAVGAAQVSQ
jgi:hypothetical protein